MLALPPLFGRFLVKTGKVTEQQVRDAVRLQHELAGDLAEAAILRELLSPADVRQVKQHQRKSGLFFAAAVEALGLASAEALRRLETELHEGVIPLGEALVAQGAMTEAQLGDALTEFERYKDEP